MGLLLSFLLVFTQGFSSPYFRHLRKDQTVPEACRQMKLSFYQLPSEKLFVGRLGGVSMGFTTEYPIARRDATTLWKYFKGLAKGTDNEGLRRKILKNKDLKRDYEIILRTYEEQDFDFGSEGEILEVLAIHDLYNEFPENHYYITGGVEYHNAGSSRTLGEVDLFIGDRQTCESVVIGEVKLGNRKTLSKARGQLARFSGFLRSHGVEGLGPEYQFEEDQD